MFIRAIKNYMGVNVLKDKMHIHLRDWENFLLKKLCGKSCLNSHHKQARMACARKKMSYGDKWFIVLFSEEKNWKLLVPELLLA